MGTDGRTDGHKDHLYTPANFAGGIICYGKKSLSFRIYVIVETIEMLIWSKLSGGAISLYLDA